MSNEPADRPQQILVINPNTSEAVTRAIDEALAPLRRVGGPAIVVDYLREGPPGIVSQRDADSVIPPLAARIGREGADAFVIACFSDPGLQSAREAAMGRPVFGIAECAILSALTMGERFGVIALSSGSVKRQQRDVRLMGVGERYAGSCPADVTPAETASPDVRDRLTDAGRTLVSRHGADVLILGCAGMAAHRRALEETIGRPVVEPSQQAVAMAIGRLWLAKS